MSDDESRQAFEKFCADYGDERTKHTEGFWEVWQARGEWQDRQDLLLREFRVALQRISNGMQCECDHEDENCCEEVEEFCPTCIAGKALAKELPAPPEEEKA